MNALSKLYASHDMDNTSDHKPLTIQFDIQADRFSASVRSLFIKLLDTKRPMQILRILDKLSITHLVIL